MTMETNINENAPAPTEVKQARDASIKIREGLLITVFLFVTSFLIFILILKQNTLLEAIFYRLFYNAIHEGYALKEFIPLIFINIGIFIPLIVTIIIKKRLCANPKRLLYELPGYSLAVSIVVGFVLMSMMFPAMYWVPLALVASIVLGFYYYFSNVSKSFRKLFLILMALLFLFEAGYIGSQAFPAITGGESYCGPSSGSGYVDYGCFGEKATRENNPDVCDVLSDKTYRDFCLAAYARESAESKRDMDYCGDFALYGIIDNESYKRNECIRTVLERVGTSLCDEKGMEEVKIESIDDPFTALVDEKRKCYQLYCDLKEIHCYDWYNGWQTGVTEYYKEEDRKRMETCFHELEGNLSLPKGVPFKRRTQYAEGYCNEFITAKFGEETIITVAENQQ
ncbi:MAG: hypothetical protein WC852_02165 [Candidatus Nanoarchaeia archaeon]|jgi:hypothetical protein